MSNDKITRVFVRLPLSNEQRMVANEAPYKSDRKGSALEASILAIGMPVVNSDVEAVCSIDESILRDIRDLDENDEEYVTDMVFRPDYTGETVALVRQSDHLAALSQRDAEIARLREALRWITYTAHDLPEFMRVEIMLEWAEKALKGPEA